MWLRFRLSRSSDKLEFPNTLFARCCGWRSTDCFPFREPPLRLAVTAGLAATCLSLLVSLLYSWTHGGGLLFTCLLVAIHLVPASLFAAIGVVGEYVCRIHEECKRRPLYVVKAETPEASERRRRAA